MYDSGGFKSRVAASSQIIRVGPRCSLRFHHHCPQTRQAQLSTKAAMPATQRHWLLIFCFLDYV